MASITPAQRVFGIGMTPIEKAFRPPEGMEYDPAYNDFARQKWAKADMEDAQREAVRAQTEEARAKREQLAADRATRQIEDDAIAAMKERPDEIPNILRSFPELARSRNLGGVLNYAKAVTPTAAQKTLVPSLRMKLDPSELRHFDEAFNQTGDALSAYDQARLKGENERGFAEMLGKGVPLEVAMQHKDKMLTPFERAAIVNEHTRKSNWSPEQKALLEGAMRDIDDNYTPATGESAFDVAMNKSKLKQQLIAAMLTKSTGQQPPAIATPAAEGGNVAPAVAPAPTAVPVATPAPFVAPSPEDNIKRLEEALKAPAPEGLLPHQIEAQRAETRKKLADAQENLSIQKVANDVVAPVWSEEKADIDSLVSNYAKEMGYPAQSVWNAIASGAPLPSMSGQRGLVPAAYAILGENIYSVNPKFEKALSTLKGEASKVRPIGTFFSGIGGEFTPPTKNKILEAYAKEKAKPVASAAPAVNVASPEWKPGQSVAVPGGGTITRNK